MLLDYQGQDEGINRDAYLAELRLNSVPDAYTKVSVVFKDHREQRFHDLIGAGCSYHQAYIDAGYDPDDLPF